MKYRTLGRTGLRVSEMGFGAWAIGGTSYGPTRDEDSLVTFNIKHYPSENRQGVIVSLPEDFLNLYRKKKTVS